MFKSWHILFSSIVISCKTKTEDSGGEPATTVAECEGEMCYGTCLTPSEQSVAFTVSEEEFSEYLDESGVISAEACSELCRSWIADNYFTSVNEVLSCETSQNESELQVDCTAMTIPYCEGRFHESVSKPHHSSEGTPIQQWLSRAAQAERASVQSFVILAKELERFCLPKSLLNRIHQAAREEVYHARMMNQLCRDHHVSVPEMVEAGLSTRSILEIAIENVEEGCVHERYAALQAHYQAEHLQNSKLKQCFAQIAHDETEHTKLAEDLHHWLMSQLRPAEQELVNQAKIKAQIALEAHLSRRAVPRELQQALGLPSQDHAQLLVRELHRLAA